MLHTIGLIHRDLFRFSAAEIIGHLLVQFGPYVASIGCVGDARQVGT